MNKIYSTVWSKALGQIVVASELAKSGKKGSKAAGGSRATRPSRRHAVAVATATALIGGLGFSAGALADFNVSDGTDSTNVDTSSSSPDTLEFAGDGNILVTLDDTGPKLTFGLADDVTIADSLTVGNISLTNDTLSFIGGGPSISSMTGIDAGNMSITSVKAVAPSSGGTAAATTGQLFSTNQDVSQNASDITANTGAISTNSSDIATNTSDINTNSSDIATNTGTINPNSSDITTNTGNIGTNSTKIATNTSDITALQGSVGSLGTDALQWNGSLGAYDASHGTSNPQIITNVKAGDASGSGSTDAINGGQFHDMNQSIATALGTTLDGNGDLNAPSYTVASGSGAGTTNFDNVKDALEFITGVNGGQGVGIKYFHANSTEADSIAAGDNSVAIGPKTDAEADDSFAAGHGADVDATSTGAIALGNNAKVDHDSENSVVIGTDAKTNPQAAPSSDTANDAVVIGHAAEVVDHNAVAMGHDAFADQNSVGIGHDAKASGYDGVAMGHGAEANMNQDVAIGYKAGDGSSSNSNSDIQNVYIGTSAGASVAHGGHNVAVGYQAGMNRGDNSDENIAMGAQAGKGQTGRANLALGYHAASSGLNSGESHAGSMNESIALGHESDVGDSYAIAIGSEAFAIGNASTAVGYNAWARGTRSLALGFHADAQRSGSVALGSNSLVDSGDDPSSQAFLTAQTADHILSIGAPAGSVNGQVLRRITNVAGGVSGNDAVNVAQLQTAQNKVATLVGGGVTVDANGDYSGLTIGSNNYNTIADAIAGITGGPGGTGPGGTYVQYNTYGGVQVAAAQAAGDAVNKGQMDAAIDGAKTHYFSYNPDPAHTNNYTNNAATGIDALAMGQATAAAGNDSIAIGRNSHAGTMKPHEGAIAIGYNSDVRAQHGISMGQESRAYDDNASAIGYVARADGLSSIAFGDHAQVEVVGNGSADDGIAIGTHAYVNADQGQAFGNEARTDHDAKRGVAIGDNAHSHDAEDAYAIGTRADASGPSAHAEGTDSVANAANAYAKGTNAKAHAADSQAYGTGAITQTYATNSIAFGKGTKTGSSNPNLTSTDNIAMGTNSDVKGDHSLAIGAGNTIGLATGSGANSELHGNRSGAFGNGNTIQQDNTFVVGNGVTTTQANSVVLGNASTDRAATPESGITLYGKTRTFAGPGSAAKGVVSVGDVGEERQIINVAAGKISADSTDAVNGSQLYQTNQAVDDFAGDMATYLGGGASHDPNGNVTQPM